MIPVSPVQPIKGIQKKIYVKKDTVTARLFISSILLSLFLLYLSTNEKDEQGFFLSTVSFYPRLQFLLS